MLFRWFVGLSMDALVWDVTVFTKNRDRLLEGDIARTFLLAVLADPKIVPLLSDEHFSVDGTLIEAAARRPASATSMASSAATTAMPPPLIRTPASIRRQPDRRPSCAIWRIC
jgi:transposase